MTETFIKSRKHNLTGKVEPVRHRRRQRVPGALSATVRWRPSRPRATRAGTRRSTRSRSTASTRPSSGTCTICTACNISTTATRAASAAGAASISRDGDHPYMKHWWVPGLQIGYEHTFIHQAADFLRALGEGKSASPTFREALATDYVTDAVLESAANRHWVKVQFAGRGRRYAPLGGNRWSGFSLRGLPLAALRALQAQPRIAPDSGNRLPADLRRQVAGRLGWRPRVLARRRRRAGGADLDGQAAEAEHVPDLAWRQPADFELRLDFRLTGFNSGIQFRSIELPDIKWAMKGYQADMDGEQRYTGQIYEERGRGFLALRGQFSYIGEDQKPALVGFAGRCRRAEKADPRRWLEQPLPHRPRQYHRAGAERPPDEHADRR